MVSVAQARFVRALRCRAAPVRAVVRPLASSSGTIFKKISAVAAPSPAAHRRPQHQGSPVKSKLMRVCRLPMRMKISFSRRCSIPDKLLGV
ncbi:MAG: hypothetical protein MZV70_64470 [Desulfobacterales bacterium]|nr:hypothetical protein [Desulfobacterales bacterium]